jgi:tetratricopeptide (TPR) repeat protein
MKKLFKHSKKAGRQLKLHLNYIKQLRKQITNKDELCDECKALGYCRVGREKESITYNSRVIKFDIRKYMNYLPLRIEGSRYGQYSKFHLQTALDAFHQEDYETAILHFRATIENAAHLAEAYYGLTLSYFIIKDYENAMTFADRYNGNLDALKEEIVRCYNNDIANKQLESEIQKILDDKEMPTDKLTNVKEYVLQNI